MSQKACDHCGTLFTIGGRAGKDLTARFCSNACRNIGRWAGPSGELYRQRLGAARRRWNEANPEANRERIAKIVRARGHHFPGLEPKRSGRAVAAQLVPLTACVDCGRPKSGPRSLHRHHIDGDPTNNVRSNLAVVCVPCHRRRHDGMDVSFGTPRVKPRACRGCGREFTPERSNRGGIYCTPSCYHANYVPIT